MKIFHCHNCLNPVYFENTHCEKCGSALGYLNENNDIVVLKPSQNAWQTEPETGKLYQYCQNHEYDACNWLVALEDINDVQTQLYYNF